MTPMTQYNPKGNWRGDVGGRVIPEFGYKLGPPVADAVVDSNGVYTRTFGSGTVAVYNPKTGLGKITWASKSTATLALK